MGQLDNDGFWNWFSDHSEEFLEIVKAQQDVAKLFVNPVLDQLNKLRNGYYVLVGMIEDDLAELIITADGDVRVIPFIEQLVAAAPSLSNWKMTALKPPSPLENFAVNFSQGSLSADTLHFIFKEENQYPDLLNIDIVHDEITDLNRGLFEQGIFIYLENYIGELQCLELIDGIAIKSKSEAEGELISMHKLDSFLKWRHKEQVEKYDQVKHTSDEDQYTGYETKLESGDSLITTINTNLLNWEHLAAYPWITIIVMKYKEGNNGMPSKEENNQLYNIEEQINKELTETLFCLNVGRQTGENKREIYYASKDFRVPAIALDKIAKNNNEFSIQYEIYKDKYWQTFERFKAL